MVVGLSIIWCWGGKERRGRMKRDGDLKERGEGREEVVRKCVWKKGKTRDGMNADGRG